MDGETISDGPPCAFVVTLAFELLAGPFDLRDRRVVSRLSSPARTPET